MSHRRSLLPALLIGLLATASCDRQEGDCAAAKTALMRQLSVDRDEVLALAEDDDFVRSGLPPPPSERDRRIAENADLDIERGQPDLEVERKKLRAGAKRAHAKLTGWVEQRFEPFCRALPKDEAECIASWGRWQSDLRQRQIASCKDREGDCWTRLREEARAARPDCARFDQRVDAFLAGAR